MRQVHPQHTMRPVAPTGTGPMSFKHSAMAVFSAGLIGLGVLGLASGDFALVWQRVPAWVPEREPLAYACALVSLACGAGLIWLRTAPYATTAALLYLFLWWLLLRVPAVIASPLDSGPWGGLGENGIMLAGALALHADCGMRMPGLPFLSGTPSIRIARMLLGASLLACGQFNVHYFADTANFIPGWIPAHVFWAGLTAAAFIAAGLGILFSVLARLAAILVTGQMMTFTVLIWLVEVIVAPERYHWTGLLISWLISSGAWLVAHSYRPMAVPAFPPAHRQSLSAGR